MPRYIVQRTFPEQLALPVADGGAELCRGVIEQNAEEGVTWVHSYVSEDKRTTFCVYDAPDPGGDPQDGRAQPAARRRDHPGARPRPVLLRLRSAR